MALRLVATLAGIALVASSAAGCPGGGGSGGKFPMATVGEPDGTADGSEGEGGRESETGANRSDAGNDGAGAEAGTGSNASGGGTGPAADGGVEPLPAVQTGELPDVFARAICDALASCVGAAKLRELTEREDCAARVAAELAATEFYLMEDAIASGHVLYDPSELHACLDGVRELGCDVLSDSFPQPCDGVIAGNVELGGECAISAECQGTAFCAGAASGTCPSTCSELLAQGVECSADNECGDGLMCMAGTCQAPSRGGEPCGGDSGKACALGFNCMGSTDVDVGECTDNASVQVGDEGDACMPGGALCVEGLSCVFDGAGAFHCEPYVGAGAACHLGLPGQCPVAEYCDAASVMEQGSCRALPGDGASCVLGDVCAPGSVCVAEADEPVCRPIRANGGDCSANQACRSANCLEGKCEPPPTCGL
jgi:hypothetical protein